MSFEVRVAVRLREVVSNSDGEMSREILAKTFSVINITFC